MAALYRIRPGMKVRLLDGGTASVASVLNPEAHWGAPKLVVRIDSPLARKVVASYAAVAYVDGAVHLNLSTRQLRALPAFDALRHALRAR
jgi:hypothetical protein